MVTDAQSRLLVLWDIDHTLLAARGFGQGVYTEAFAAVFGRDLVTVPDMAGRTELDIMTDTLRLNGIEPTEDLLAELAGALIIGYRNGGTELAAQGRALPGAEETLAALAAHPAIHQSVLTGNLREVARIKLETFGLHTHLDLDSGGYGGEEAERAKLVGIAQDRVAENTGIAYDNDATVLVGDTPRDVAAALTAGTRVIAVSTGKFDSDELREAGAHYVVDDLDTCRGLILEMVNPQ